MEASRLDWFDANRKRLADEAGIKMGGGLLRVRDAPPPPPPLCVGVTHAPLRVAHRSARSASPRTLRASSSRRAALMSP